MIVERETVLDNFFPIVWFQRISICTPWKVSENSEQGRREGPKCQKLQTKVLTEISGGVGDSSQNTFHEGWGLY